MRISTLWKLLDKAEEARDYLAGLDDEDAEILAEELEKLAHAIRSEEDID